MDSFQNFSILSWNIRGAFSRSAKRNIRDIIKSVLFDKVENFWASVGYIPVFLHEARGHSGGLWVLSSLGDTVFTLLENMHQSITFEVRRRTDNWFCSFIYASPLFSNRSRLSEHLEHLRPQVQGPRLILGDFNEILFSTEVSGGSFNPTRASLLAQMMSTCSFLDIHTVGGMFTWRKNVQLAGHVRKCLDRAVADVDWHLAFPHAIVEVLPQHGSDHNPLLLSCIKNRSKSAKMFHFQAAWMTHPDYDILVRNSWNQSNGEFSAKLDNVRQNSITFNKDTFGNIFKKKRQLEARIKGVHLQLDTCPTHALIILEKELQDQYADVLEEEEMLWFQKSRENWVKLGNKNTKFYHAQTVIHRRRNKVSSLQINGDWCTDDELLKKEATTFFKSLFQSSDTCMPASLALTTIPHISQELHDVLLRPVTRREVKDALFSMDPYKAPGPNGFQPIFYKNYWHIVSTDVWELVACAFQLGHIDPFLAKTLIVLIPKIDEPLTFQDFRPISLCNVMLKLISKVLVRRIRPFLDDLIGPLQSSFIPNRGTSDNALIAQELVHYMHKKKGGKVVFLCSRSTLRRHMIE